MLLKAVVDPFSSSSMLDYYESSNQCGEKANLASDVSFEINVGGGMLFHMSS